MKHLNKNLLFMVFIFFIAAGCEQPQSYQLSEVQRALINEIISKINITDYSSRLLLFSNPRHAATSTAEIITVENAIISDLQTWYSVSQVHTQEVTLAKQHIRNYVNDYGWVPGPLTMRNIFAFKTGHKPELKPVIIAAHHDTVAYVPGTNDNGTGCAGVLEAAFQLKDYNFDRTIIFAFFAFEEDGYIGSEQYAASLSPEEYPDSVIVLETIGHTHEEQRLVPGADLLLSMPTKGDFIGVFGSRDSRNLCLDFLTSVKRNASDLPVFSVAVDNNFGSNPFFRDILRSDHSPFWFRGIPALMITDTANLRENHPYHTPQDNYANVDREFALKVVKASISTLCVRAGIQ